MYVRYDSYHPWIINIAEKVIPITCLRTCNNNRFFSSCLLIHLYWQVFTLFSVASMLDGRTERDLSRLAETVSVMILNIKIK